jgi:CubicO group peptidase (beta-lactamase class C family)
MKLRYGAPEEAGMSPQRIAHVARLAEGWVRDGIHPALVVLVARKGVIVLHEAFGTLRPEPDSPPLARDSIFPLASITKPITATAVMQLVEDGVLGLNRPVQEYIPEFVGEGKQDVMVHHLLTHTSGLNDFDVNAFVEQKTGKAIPLLTEATTITPVKEYLALRYDAPLSKPAGAEMFYGIVGPELLGEIVRRVAGRPLADLGRERIFGPLGMTDTNWVLPEALRPRVVMRPPGAPFPLLNTWESLTSGSATGSVSSTALDMAIFGQTFLNGGEYGGVRVLSPASVVEMTRNQIPGIGTTFYAKYYPEASWSYGWGIHGDNKWKYFDGTLHSPQTFHQSGIGGVYMWVDPVYEIVGVYFSVVMEMLPSFDHKWCNDLFVNAVTAAVMDG